MKWPKTWWIYFQALSRKNISLFPQLCACPVIAPFGHEEMSAPLYSALLYYCTTPSLPPISNSFRVLVCRIGAQRLPKKRTKCQHRPKQFGKSYFIVLLMLVKCFQTCLPISLLRSCIWCKRSETSVQLLLRYFWRCFSYFWRCLRLFIMMKIDPHI